MSRKATCLDNAMAENFFSLIKNEMYYGQERTFRTKEELKVAIEDYLHYYNNTRIKVGLGGLSPVQYRLSHASG